MTVRNLTEASGHSSGVVIDGRVTQDALSNWRDPSWPGAQAPEGGRSYNRQHRERDRSRAGVGWARTSDEAE
jgi:hypothetical protein